MKTILFVLPALGIGGAEKSLVDLFNEIDYERYNVTLLLLSDRGEFYSLVNKNVKVVELRDEYKMLFQNASISIPYFIRRYKILICAKIIVNGLLNRLPSCIKPNMAQIVWRVFKSRIPLFAKKYDVAIGYLQGIAEYFVADKVNATKKIFWMHTSFAAHSKGNQIEKKYIEKYDKIVCVSKAAKNDFINTFPFAKYKTDVFYNIINKNEIIRKAEEKSEICFDKTNFNIISVGRLHPCKGYDIALEALSNLIKVCPNVHYYIVGSGIERNKIIKKIKKLQISEYCTLLGAQSNPYKFIKQSNLLLQASRYEGFCIALSEALSLGKPVITTDFFGAQEQIVNGVTGIIVKCNKNDIYNALYDIIKDTDLYNCLKNNIENFGSKRDIKTELHHIIE